MCIKLYSEHSASGYSRICGFVYFELPKSNNLPCLEVSPSVMIKTDYLYTMIKPVSSFKVM